jgi:hypothetical protein
LRRVEYSTSFAGKVEAVTFKTAPAFGFVIVYDATYHLLAAMRERCAMGLRIELPEDLVHDLEQEATRRHVSLVEIIREALHIWRASRETPENDRERVMQVLRDRGLLCQLPSELAACAQPLSVEELDQLATKAAQGRPLSELIVQERRGEA